MTARRRLRSARAQATHAILAGGLGTRLRPVAGGEPKALVPVHGRPFLEWLLVALRRRGVRRVVLCTGVGHDRIAAAFGDGRGLGVQLTYSVESSPLGTAGAVVPALPLLRDPFVLWNGDTFSTIHWRGLWESHLMRGALATIAVVRAADARDFGSVTFASNRRVLAFDEKVAGGGPQWINGGVYALSHAALRGIPADRAASLERDVFPSLVRRTRRVYAYRARRPVFDIGTPDRLAQFSQEFARGDLVRP